jgi:hypothetical protein
MSPQTDSRRSVHNHVSRWSTRSRLLIAVAVVLYVLVLVAHIATREPQPDEAMAANPAWTLATRGYLGTTVFEEAGWRFQGVNTHTYYIFPLYPFLMAGVYQIAGFGLWQLRGTALASTLVLFWLLYKLLRTLGISRNAALLAVGLTAVDYQVQIGASFGRYDMLVAAFGFGGYVAYLTLEKRNFALAMVIANACIACSGITHPNGLLYFLGLWTMVAMDGMRRLRPAALAAAAAPYVIGALCWGAYILQAPEDFRQQLSANSGKRVMITQPVAALRAEITERYLPAFGFSGGHSAGHSGPIRLKVIPLVFYAAFVGIATGVRAVRRQAGVSRLLLLTGVHFFYLCFVEGMKFPYYLPHIIPLYCSLGAVAIVWFWNLRPDRIWRGAVAGALGMLMLVQVGGVLLRVRLNTYGKTYAPAVAFLRQHAGNSDLIMGTCDLGFAFRFAPNVIDDIHLGYESGKRPRFIVIEEAYRSNLQAWKTSRHPAERSVYEYASDLLAREYRVVYDQATYQIYERRPMQRGSVEAVDQPSASTSRTMRSAACPSQYSSCGASVSPL